MSLDSAIFDMMSCTDLTTSESLLWASVSDEFDCLPGRAIDEELSKDDDLPEGLLDCSRAFLVEQPQRMYLSLYGK